eukprot:6004732-Pyramimonas_sp.AAC.1
MTLFAAPRYCSGLEDIPPPDTFTPSARFAKSTAAEWGALRELVLAHHKALIRVSSLPPLSMVNFPLPRANVRSR